jgi:hypothetical protein
MGDRRQGEGTSQTEIRGTHVRPAEVGRGPEGGDSVHLCSDVIDQDIVHLVFTARQSHSISPSSTRAHQWLREDDGSLSDGNRKQGEGT